ncbi:hypothetical protein ISN76_13220 [Dyella halodurans]|uniref:PD-(D/E)XK endonuclease-like domain-containing protein n=1 Tax=Dyella halodurans TaxID=1920171 RepID=A0ABV9BZI7_9GAMM|nr:hypothetical protein [Dyella halodurans]
MAQVQSFLDSCTIDPSELRFTVNLLSGEEAGIPREWTQFLFRRFNNTYGTAKEKTLGSALEYSWSIPESDVANQVDFLGSLGSLPTHQHGMQPLCVTAHRVIKLIDCKSGVPWPHQDPSSYSHFQVSGYGEALGRSVVYTRISDRSSMNLFLNFPFEPGDPELPIAVKSVQDKLPFSMSKSHWKYWKLTKAGDKYLGRKMTSPLGV